MGFTIGSKLALSTGVIVLAAGVGVTMLSSRAIDERLQAGLKAELESASALLASRVAAEVRGVAALQTGESVERLTVYSEGDHGVWKVDREWVRGNREALARVDLQFPVDIARAGRGDSDAVPAAMADGTPLLRVAVPAAQDRVAVAELSLRRLRAAFVSAAPALSYLVDRNGRVIAQGEPEPFVQGEKVDSIPIVQAAITSRDATNAFVAGYAQVPGGMERVGSYHRVGIGGLTVVSEAPRSLIAGILKRHTRQSAYVFFGAAFLAMGFALWTGRYLIARRLTRIAGAASRAAEGQGPPALPDTRSSDEVGTLARKMSEVFEELRNRLRSPSTFQKFGHHKSTLLRFQKGELPSQGERRAAYILVGRLAGVDKIASDADPAALVYQLNRFSQACVTAVEENGGIADRVGGGTFVAFWGVPDSSAHDAEGALSACIALRKAVKTLNEQLKKAGLADVRFSAAVHYGEVLAAHFGFGNRVEYTIAGDGLTVATRIEGFTESLGTDVLVTGAVVDRAPKWFSLERAASADENAPELHELLGSSAKKFTTVPAAAKPALASAPAEGTAPVKRKRGRPRKQPLAPPTDQKSADKVLAEAEAAERAIEEDLRKVA